MRSTKKKTNGIRNRNKWNWYERGQKSSNFFLNLAKSCGSKSNSKYLNR